MHTSRYSLWLVVGVAVLLAGSSVRADDACIVRRAAFDVGSGTTRMQVADVNVCVHRVASVILSEEAPVEYQVALESSVDGRFSAEMMDKGRRVLREMKSQALAAGATSSRRSPRPPSERR